VRVAEKESAILSLLVHIIVEPWTKAKKRYSQNFYTKWRSYDKLSKSLVIVVAAPLHTGFETK